MAFKFCPECGFKLNGEYKFCPECGYKLAQSGEKAPQQALNKEPQIQTKIKEKVEKSVVDDNDVFSLEASFDKQIKNKEKAENDYQTKLKAANVHILKGENDKAEEIYESLIEENPLDLNAYVGLLRISTRNFTNYFSEKAEKEIKFIVETFSKKQVKSIVELQKYLINKKIAIILEEKKERTKKETERNNKNRQILNSLSFEKIGDSIWFGTDVPWLGKSGKKKESVSAIDWQMLEAKNGIALLMSEKLLFETSLDNNLYKQKTPSIKICYEGSSVQWYLKKLYDESFNDVQKSVIYDTEFESLAYPGKQITEKVFILSRSEFIKYKDKMRMPKQMSKDRSDAFYDRDSMLLRDCENNVIISCITNTPYNDAKQYGVDKNKNVYKTTLSTSLGVAPVIRVDLRKIERIKREHALVDVNKKMMIEYATLHDVINEYKSFEKTADKETFIQKCDEYSMLIDIAEEERKKKLALQQKKEKELLAEEEKKALLIEKERKEDEEKLKEQERLAQIAEKERIEKQRKEEEKRSQLETAILSNQDFIVEKIGLERVGNKIKLKASVSKNFEWNIFYENDSVIYMMAAAPYVKTTFNSCFSMATQKNEFGVEGALRHFGANLTQSQKDILRGEKMISEKQTAKANIIRVICEEEVNLWKSKLPYQYTGFWVEEKESGNDKVATLRSLLNTSKKARCYKGKDILDGKLYVDVCSVYPFIVIDKQKLVQAIDK